jgi:ABC-type amino acid transport substrate-binding protein
MPARSAHDPGDPLRHRGTGSRPGWSLKFLRKRFPGNKWSMVVVDPVDREKSIVTGKVDLVVANYSIEGSAVAYDHPDKLRRREMIDFAGPYFVDRSGIMIHPER